MQSTNRPRVVIIGDRMEDIDESFATVKRHEGVPVVVHYDTVTRPGGSDNVAVMCSALGAEVMSLGLGVSQKRRLFVNGTLTMRVDSDKSASPPPEVVRGWRVMIDEFKPDLILVCDHAKGVVSASLMEMIRKTGVPVYVDPCTNSDWSLFAEASCISANRFEWERGQSGRIWREGPMTRIIRLDADGVVWRDDSSEMRLPSECREVVDTVGAGDQFFAVLACCRIDGKSWGESIALANRAAGMQCERQGIVPVTWVELNENSRPELIGCNSAAVAASQ